MILIKLLSIQGANIVRVDSLARLCCSKWNRPLIISGDWRDDFISHPPLELHHGKLTTQPKRLRCLALIILELSLHINLITDQHGVHLNHAHPSTWHNVTHVALSCLATTFTFNLESVGLFWALCPYSLSPNHLHHNWHMSLISYFHYRFSTVMLQQSIKYIAYFR